MLIRPSLTLHHNFSWTLLSTIIYAACQWGVLVVLAKLGNATMVGEFTLGLAVTAPVVMLTNLRLQSAQATDATRQYSFQEYLGLRCLTSSIAFLIIIGITVAAQYSPETTWVILLIGVAKVVESLTEIAHGLLQQNERMDRIAFSFIIRGLITLILVTLVLAVHRNVIWAMAAIAIAWLLNLVFYDLWSIRKFVSAALTDSRSHKHWLRGFQPKWHWQKLSQLVSLTFPLGIGMMLVSLSSNFPHYLIEHYWGPELLGIFASILYLMEASNRFILALGETCEARLAKYYASGNFKAFFNLFIRLLAIAITFGVINLFLSWLLGKPLLSLIYKPEYATYSHILIWLMGVAICRYLSAILGYTMTAARYFRIQMPLFSITALTVTCSSLWLIPRWGLQGAAWSLLIATSLQVVIGLGVMIHALRRLACLSSASASKPEYTHPFETKSR